jgi:hypothetical protein
MTDTNINVENSKSLTESYEVVQKPSLLSPSFTKASEADEDQTPTRERVPPRIFGRNADHRWTSAHGIVKISLDTIGI